MEWTDNWNGTHGGYFVSIIFDPHYGWGYTIREEIAPKKMKVRRKSVGHTDQVAAQTNMENFIDNHIVPWSDSPNNPKNRKR